MDYGEALQETQVLALINPPNLKLNWFNISTYFDDLYYINVDVTDFG